MTTYYLRTGGAIGSDDLNIPAIATKTFSQWRLGGPNGKEASGPPGAGDDVISASLVSLPGLKGSLSVKTWTVQGSGQYGNADSVNFINGNLTIDTIVIQGSNNLGFIVNWSSNPADSNQQSASAVLNVKNTPIAAAGGVNSIENATNVGENYTVAMAPWTIESLVGAVVNISTVATTGADHITAIVYGGTLNVSDKFNDLSNLQIENAATVTINGTMDPAADSKTGPYTNTITVTGAGSRFISNASTFTVGGGSADTGIEGTFNVQNGATATLNGEVTVGDKNLDVGNISVTGKGSGLTVNGAVSIGQEGQGNLTVSNGGSLVVYGDVTEAVKAAGPLGSGTDLLSDAGVTVAIHGDWKIGVAAARTDAINGAANVTVAGALELGGEETGQGTLNVTGQGTSLTITAAGADVTIGGAGTGVLRLSRGATFDAGASDVTVGDQSSGGGQQQNLLDIEAAEMVAGNLTIGGSGSGNLTMENAAVLTVLSDLTFGDDGGSKYTASIQLSSLSVGGDLVIGGSGKPGSGVPAPADANNPDQSPLTGANVLVNSSSVTAANITLGDNAEGKGALVLDLSSMTTPGDMKIGGGGSGTVLVQLSSRLVANTITLGDEFGATGSMTIDQSLVASNALTVGSHGKGSLTVTDGGVLITDGIASLGDQAVANIQSVSIKSSSWSVDGDLQDGEAGIAQLTVQSGGFVRVKNIFVIGDLTASGGIATIKGNGTAVTSATPAIFASGGFGFGLSPTTGLPVGTTSALTTSVLQWGETLTVGGSGVGTLNISAGAIVAPLSGGTGDVEIGAQSGSTGTLTLSGSSLLIANELSIGGTRDATGGSGTLAAGKGDTVDIAGDLRLWQGGKLNVSGGGSVSVGGSASAKGTVSIGNKGTLMGAGTIAGGVNDSGLIDASGGTLALTSGAVTGTGTIQIDSGATFDLSAAKSGDTIATLTDAGALLLGSNALTVTGAYTNANWGSGNSFNPTANVTGGQIVGNGAALKVLSQSLTKNKSGLVLTFNKIAGGLQQATFSLENSGTGATITAAVRTAALNSDVTGIAAGNVTLAHGQSSSTYTLTYDPSAGSLAGQQISIVSDFANVAPITISLAPASPLKVVKLNATFDGEAAVGNTVAVTVSLSEPLTVDTSGGSPTIELSNGATASYAAAASNLPAGSLVFAYVVAAGDSIPDLQIANVDLTGALVQDTGGNEADFTGALNTSMGLQINPAFVTAVVPSQTTPATPNATVQLTLNLSEGVTISGGAPMLTLSDGGTALYDAAASNAAAGSLVFNYVVGTNDRSPNVEVSAVVLNGAVILDQYSVAANLSGAVNVPTALQIGASPLTVTNFAASKTGALQTGTLGLTLTMSEAVSVDLTNGTPTLTLNDGGAAVYDADLSNPSAGILVFDYSPLAGEYSADLAVTAVALNGAVIADANGYTPNFTAALNVPTGVEIGAASVMFDSYTLTGNHARTGVPVAITLNMNEAVSVTGAPELTLSDGAIATYDAAASVPLSGTLVFDYLPGVGDYTTDLRVSGVNLNGGAVLDKAGHAADLSGAAADLGLDVNAVFLNAATVAPASGIISAGQTVQVTLDMSAEVTVTGAPSLALNDGATGAYDTKASNPSAGLLVFDYVVGSSEASPNLAIATVALNGGAILDANGHAADLATNRIGPTGLQIGSKLTVSSVAASVSGEADAGQTVRLTIVMNEAVTVTGTPLLSLNDGATASYDAQLSNPGAGTLVFDYLIGANDSSTNLAISAVDLSAVTAVRDAAGFNANFNGALNVATGLRIGPSSVIGVTASRTGVTATGQTVSFTLAMSAPVTVTGAPSLTLSDGGTATYYVALSTPTSLVFDYTAGANDQQSKSVRITGVVVPPGASIVETANALSANLGGALNVGTGVQIGTPLSVGTISAGSTLLTLTGGTIDIRIFLNEDGILNTTNGLPTLTLNDGGTAIYNGDTSGSPNSALDFIYTVGSNDRTPNLAVTSVNLNGATLVDAAGFGPDFSAALNQPLGVPINPTPVADQVFTNYGNVATFGAVVTITLDMNELVTVTGTPELILNDGGTAVFASSSNFTRSGLSFNYTVAASEKTPNLEVTAVNLAGGSVKNANGQTADFSSILNAPIGLQISAPLTESSVTANPGTGEASAGQTVKLTLQVNEPVVVDTSAGAPIMDLSLASGHESQATPPPSLATAVYDANASSPQTGQLVFDYTVAAGQETENLSVSDLNLNGATINDTNGFAPNNLFNGTLNIFQSTGLQIGPSFVNSSFNLTNNLGVEASPGQTVQLVLRMTTPSTVTGTPFITLNNGGTATYDPAAPVQDNKWLVFDYTVGQNDTTPALLLKGVTIPNGASIKDTNGVAADFSGATGDNFYVQIGPDTVTSVGTDFFNQPTAFAGDLVRLKIELQYINLNISGGPLSLTLNNGATATYDAAYSQVAYNGYNRLVFDYTVGANDPFTNSLQVSSLNLNGATVKDTYGTPPDLSGALNVGLGVRIVAPPPPTTTVPNDFVYAYPTGYQSPAPLMSGQTIQFEFYPATITGGAPTITLNDGGTATYDAALSTSGAAVFDYTVGPNDRTPLLDIARVNLNGATATAGNLGVDFTKATLADLGLQVGPSPLKVTSIVPSTTLAASGQTVRLSLTLNEAVTLNTPPTLKLNDGGTATYDPGASNPSTGTLVFDYTVGQTESTLDLQVTAVTQDTTPGPQDATFYPPDYTGALNVSTGLQITPLVVNAVVALPAHPTVSGEIIHVGIKMNEAVIVNTAGGAPVLTLNDGAIATFDAAASQPSAGSLVFDYTIAPTDKTPNLEVAAVTLPSGTTVRDAGGYSAAFAGALNFSTGLRIGASPLMVTAVTASPNSGEVGAGQNVALTVKMNEAVTVDTTKGLPRLALNDGGAATYDATKSVLGSGLLVFDYTVGSGERTPNLVIEAVYLNGATVADANAANADFTAALKLPTGLQVGPAFVHSVQTYEAGSVTPGDSAHVALYLSEGVTVTGAPTLTLNDGGTATYDVTGSSTQTGLLLFDYAVGSHDATPDLQVTGVNLPDGTSVRDGNGVAADLSGADAVSTGLTVAVSCFAAGTRIRTNRGDMAVEDLVEDDKVFNVIEEKAAPIIWIGHREVNCARHPRPSSVWPVRISAGAFGPSLPARDLMLSPDHAVLVDGVLIPIKDLINGTSIVQSPVDRVTYYHVELPDHGVVLAEGLPSESYLDVGDRTNFANAGGPVALYPEFVARVWEAKGCAPFVVTGTQLEAVRRKVWAKTCSTFGRDTPDRRRG